MDDAVAASLVDELEEASVDEGSVDADGATVVTVPVVHTGDDEVEVDVEVDVEHAASHASKTST